MPPYKCPTCQNEKNKIINSRKTNLAVKRRYKCLACDKRWTTYEVTEELLRELEENSIHLHQRS
jgi:transcriptional regulator NrdR family protein